MNDSEVIQDAESNFSWNGYDIIPLGGNRMRIKDEDYDLTPGIQTAFTDTRNNFIDINIDERVLSTDKILDTLLWDHTKYSIRKPTRSIEKDLIKRVDKILSPPSAAPPAGNEESEEESGYSEGQGIKITIPANIIDVYTRSEILLEIKLSGHTNFLREAWYIIISWYFTRNRYRSTVDF